jgi:hypothetical protein
MAQVNNYRQRPETDALSEQRGFNHRPCAVGVHMVGAFAAAVYVKLECLHET